MLRWTFRDAHVINRCFPTAWSPWSPDLTPYDFWLWEFLKDEVHQERLTNFSDLKIGISRHIENIHADYHRIRRRWNFKNRVSCWTWWFVNWTGFNALQVQYCNYVVVLIILLLCKTIRFSVFRDLILFLLFTITRNTI